MRGIIMFSFTILNSSIRTRARTAILQTPHGHLKTPNIAFVATGGTIRLVGKKELRESGAELVIANTFHLFTQRKVLGIKKMSGLHTYAGFSGPIMTDSGGFQVFSLGFGAQQKVGKILKPEARRLKNETFKKNSSESPNRVIIEERGVQFLWEGRWRTLTPEKSIKIQEELGADIIFAFDECTSPLHSKQYNEEALKRTHRWAALCLEAHTRKDQAHSTDSGQALFGIVQGGIFKDLRVKSAKFIGKMPFEGFGIGGCFEKGTNEALEWIIPYLTEDKPRHLLGIGKVKDIFDSVERGIDLFDCVIPTREGRHGVLYTKRGKIYIKKSEYQGNREIVERRCSCRACLSGITLGELHALSKFRTSQKPDEKRSYRRGQKLATLHNIAFFSRLMREIREAIQEEALRVLKKEYRAYS